MNSLHSSKLSVCIPAYNEEKYILRCLKSVSNQNNVEIDEILVGINSSTDKTKEIVEKYSLIDPRVRVIDSTKGKVNAWNTLNSVSKNNLRIFQDGDCITSDNSYRLLLEELQYNDIVGASIERNTENRSIILKVINFPTRYIRPYPMLSGGLYLMDYNKVSSCIEEKTGSIKMPQDAINDDTFLQIMVNRVKVSDKVFVNIGPADSLGREIARFKRIRIGELRLQQKYAKLYKKKLELAKKHSKLYKLCYLLKQTTLLETILFPPIMLIKYFIFGYIHYQVNKVNLNSIVKWK